MRETAAVLAAKILSGVAPSVRGYDRLIVGQARASELIGREMLKQIEGRAHRVKLECAAPSVTLGEIADIRAGLSPRADDYEELGCEDTQKAFILVKPESLRERAASDVGALVLTRVRVTDRLVDRGVIVRHHDLLVALQGAPAILVVDDGDAWEGKTVPSNQVARIRFQDPVKFDVHKIASYLGEQLPVLMRKLRVIGQSRIKLDDLRLLPIPKCYLRRGK